MSNTSLTISSATGSVSISAGDTMQPGTSTASSSRSSTSTSVETTTIAATLNDHQPSTLSAVTSPPPSLPPTRPSTPPAPTGTSSNESSAHAKPADKPLTKPKRLNRLSHISIATWIGVGLTLAGLVIAVYYGIPMMRLVIWTANNDFREACKSELAAGLPQTVACNKTLDQQLQPPPLRKRLVLGIQEHTSWGSRPLVSAGRRASLFLLVWKPLETLDQPLPSEAFGVLMFSTLVLGTITVTFTRVPRKEILVAVVVFWFVLGVFIVCLTNVM